MIRLGLFLTVLSACNQWVRAEPPPAHTRSLSEQWDAAVTVKMTCDPFEDGMLAHGRVGTGVMVSDWQVLTALHVVDCQSTVPSIWVTNKRGRTWRFAPEKEWVFDLTGTRDGVARIQMRSADSLSPRFAPPTVVNDIPDPGELMFMQVAVPQKAEFIVEATGSAFGSKALGEIVIKYWAQTRTGNSGAAVYNWNGDLVGIHLGRTTDEIGYGAMVTPEMLH